METQAHRLLGRHRSWARCRHSFPSSRPCSVIISCCTVRSTYAHTNPWNHSLTILLDSWFDLKQEQMRDSRTSRRKHPFALEVITSPDGPSPRPEEAALRSPGWGRGANTILSSTALFLGPWRRLRTAAQGLTATQDGMHRSKFHPPRFRSVQCPHVHPFLRMGQGSALNSRQTYIPNSRLGQQMSPHSSHDWLCSTMPNWAFVKTSYVFWLPGGKQPVPSFLKCPPALRHLLNPARSRRVV